MTWLLTIWNTLKGWAALAGVALVALGIAFARGRRAGIDHIEAEQQKRRDNLQEHYDEIDRRPTDPGFAYDRLRKRSGGR